MAKPKGHRTTKAHFAIFTAECKRLAALWALDGWLVEFSHERLADNRAEARPDARSRVCTIALSTHWADNALEGYAPTDEDMVATARHEMCHVLLGELAGLAYDRHASHDALYAAEEALCRKLHGLLP